jgi:hypothetical protein
MFRFFGFDTSISKGGDVAFTADLSPANGSALGLFSGSGGSVSTHYTNAADVLLDGQPARFFGTFNRPAINKKGEIAFAEFLLPDFRAGIFAGSNGVFRTLAIAAPFNGSFGTPVFNEHGVAAFQANFFDDKGNFVSAIAKTDGGPLVIIADTRGAFGFFGFRPPSINDQGDVAFLGLTQDSSTEGILGRSGAGQGDRHRRHARRRHHRELRPQLLRAGSERPR